MDDPAEFAATRELDALLQGTDWWITTSNFPVRFLKGEQMVSPSHKPRDAVWFSKGGWLNHENGGVKTHVLLAKVDPAGILTVSNLAELDGFMRAYGAETAGIEIPSRSRSSSRASLSSRSSRNSRSSVGSSKSGSHSPLALGGSPPPPGELATVPLYRWREVAALYRGWAMPVNLYDPELGQGWGVCGYDVSSLALWDAEGIILETHDWDLTEVGDVSPEGWSTVKDTILPLVKAALG